jgi:hypothetical protein
MKTTTIPYTPEVLRVLLELGNIHRAIACIAYVRNTTHLAWAKNRKMPALRRAAQDHHLKLINHTYANWVDNT